MMKILINIWKPLELKGTGYLDQASLTTMETSARMLYVILAGYNRGYSRDVTNRMGGHCGDTNHTNNPPAVPIVRAYWTDIREFERDGELLSHLRL